MGGYLGWVPVAIVLALVLISCATGEPPSPPDRNLTMPVPPAAAPSVPAPVSAPSPLGGEDKASPATRRPFAEIFRGSGNLISAQPVQRSASVNASGDFSINFVNADVRDVAKTVLGDLLKLNYVADPAVQGPITIQTSQPVSRAAVLPALETALRLSGIALVKSSDDLYKLVPVANAVRQNGMIDLQSRRLRAQSAGFGVEIVPLRFVGAQEMERLLEPLVPSGSIQEVNAARNLLVIAGTQQELAAMLDDIALFDVDWLSGMSFAFISPQSVDVKTLAAELNQVFGGRESPIGGLVRLIPIERQNALIAISPQPKYLDEVAKWAERLDRPAESAEQRIYVYHVQHGRAVDLARVLNKLLTGRGGAEAGSGPIRPGETAEATIERPPAAADSLPGAAAAGPRAAPGMTAPPGGPPSPGPSALPGPAAADIGEGGGRGIGVGGGKGAHITADEINNALLVMATPREYAVIEAALRELDAVPLQVLLEAAIAEVTLTSDLQYGLQYFVQKGNSQAVLTNTALPITPSFPGFAYTFANGANISAILSAIDSVTRVDVVSAPEVLVLNNQTATLQVGDQVPIATQQAVGVLTTGAPLVNSIEYRDTGVTLQVTPRVNRGGMVLMDVSEEVSDVAATTTSTLNSPTIDERKIKSTIAVRDGETIALGGLISDSRTRSKSGVPVLGDIPVLGSLFGTRNNQVNRTELLVLITPHVIDSAQRAQSVTEELRQKLPLTRPLFQGGN